jgi:aminopeptidase YwaD
VNLLEALAAIGPRQCGTEAAARAAEAVAEAFRELGLEPRFEEFPLLGYETEEPELWVDGERWRVGPCMYAHPGECEGEVRRLANGAWAVGEGRLVRSVFGRGPIPFFGGSAAAGYIAQPPTAFLSRADAERIQEGQHARLVVRAEFVAGRVDRNVVAELPGTGDGIVVVGAHSDSVWRGPGAIDNATGVEGLRRVAERLAGETPQHTLRFVSFGAEEIGLVGARRHVAGMRERGELERAAGMVNLDCIGHGEKLELLCSPAALLERTRAAAERLGLTDRYEVVTELGQEAGTDHLPFAQSGIPALSILHFPYEEYHLPEDTIDLVDENLIRDAVDLAVAMTESLLADPVPR